MKVSKALEEVWRWKDEVAREVEEMTAAERIAYYRQATERFAARTKPGLDLKRTSRARRK